MIRSREEQTQSFLAQTACKTLQQHIERLDTIRLDDMSVSELANLLGTVKYDLGPLQELHTAAQLLDERLCGAIKRHEKRKAREDAQDRLLQKLRDVGSGKRKNSIPLFGVACPADVADDMRTHGSCAPFQTKDWLWVPITVTDLELECSHDYNSDGDSDAINITPDFINDNGVLSLPTSLQAGHVTNKHFLSAVWAIVDDFLKNATPKRLLKLAEETGYYRHDDDREHRRGWMEISVPLMLICHKDLLTWEPDASDSSE
jgi:hypothetical protein